MPVAVLVALSAPQAAFAQQPTSSVDVTVKAGILISTLTEPQGQFQSRAQRDTGWIAGVGVARRNGRRVAAAGELFVGTKGVQEFLGSRTVPIQYRFAFVEATAFARVALLRSPSLSTPLFAAAGVGIATRFKTEAADGDRSVASTNGTHVDVKLGVGTEFRRVLVELRFSQDLTAFSPVTTSLGTKHIRTVSVLLGYRIK